jgi:hypothetical protein
MKRSSRHRERKDIAKKAYDATNPGMTNLFSKKKEQGGEALL